jgi:hypothetical protein
MIVRGKYGEEESNPITDEVRKVREEIEQTVDLTDDRLARITRLRLLGDAGFPLYDLSYCYGELKDGTPVRVSLPEWQFRRNRLKHDLVRMCKRHGLYAKGLGLLDDSVISILR